MQKFPQLLATCVAAVMATSAFALTPAEQKAEKDRISADYKAAVAQCKSMNGNAKDVCEKEAKGHEKVALAELDYKKDASESNRYKAAKARADAGYDVATEKCDDQSGNAKDVCKKDAKAAHVKALEAAKVAEVRNEPNADPNSKAADVSAVRREADKNVREADYKAAAERCDALSGDAKDKCVTDAKRRFGQ
jgi:hypothetical protein